MKKLLLTLAIATTSLIGFSQNLQYEVRSNPQVNGSPVWSKDSLEVTYPYIVAVGVVGDTYGFIVNSPYSFTISVKQKYSPEELQKYAFVQAVAWVKEKYPDTK